jgi:CubicO group peptidase (beta-lactamase class C family)
LRAAALPGMRIGLAWLYVEKDGYYWHNGGTGGFSSYAFFDPKNDCAGIVLFNTTVGGSFADLLGAHVRQRLIGEAPVSLH